MKKIALAMIVVCVVGDALAADVVEVVDTPDGTNGNDHYVGNRPPLLPSPLIKLPVGAVKPKGWVRRILELQRDGAHGHLAERSGFLRKEDNAWLSADGKGRAGWEEVPYWLKGFSNCGYVLADKRMMDEAGIWIEAALRSQREDGWFGPEQGRKDLWPNMIMLFCLQSYYEHSGDKRVIDLMTKYCKYLHDLPEDKYPTPYWQHMRGGDLLFSVYWLYNRTGDQWLLKLAHKVHRKTARWDEDVINWHNVNIAQAFRGPATYYMQTKDAGHLKATEHVWQKVRDIYGQVPGGMFGGDEICREGYVGPRQAIETCAMVEEMLSDEILLSITGDPKWADRCENVAFNSFPASMTPDLKALRYLTAPNMPQSDHGDKASGLCNRGPMYLMTPHGHRCCQHNTGHGWPYYAQHLWYAAPGNGLIAEDTRYPFDETIELRLSAPAKVQFPLYLRIPGWCTKPVIKVNGREIKAAAKPRSFVKIEREWNDADRVSLTFDMDITIRTWEKNKGCVSVNRGPLTYSLKIGEKYVRHGGSDKWPEWEIFPSTPWNYGLVLSEDAPASDFKVVKKDWPADNQPFEADAVPIQMTAKAKKIPHLELDGRGLIQKMQQNPIKSDEPTETVTLIPMGAARLRLSAFPVIGGGPDARQWEPIALKVTWSYVRGWPNPLFDGKIPRSSDDNVPRMYWWPHYGTLEWLAIRYLEEKTISSVSVYWFVEKGDRACKLPESWRVFYKDGDAWKPVKVKGEHHVVRDKFDKIEFEPVKTREIKLEVQLQREPKKWSGGILEMKVE